MLHKSVPTVISEGKATKKDINYLLDGFQPSIEEIINYKFKDSSLLLEVSFITIKGYSPFVLSNSKEKVTITQEPNVSNSGE